jgi:dipeptidyl aminopeptidase/acylaminoacyl peptidase
MSEDDIEGIPAIHAVLADRAEQPLPTIFFFHGFNTSSKEVTSYFGYMLALAGFRVVLPEADLHGQRFDGDREARFGRFWEIVARSIEELPRYRDHYVRRGLVDGDRIGIGGTSMGGMVTLGAMVRHPWVRAAASYMGSGYFLDLSHTLNPPRGAVDDVLRQFDAANHLERLGDRPLFVWHGERDDVVPFAEAARLRSELAAHGLDRHLEFVSEPLGVHRVTHDAAAAGVQFFGRNL